MDKKLWGGRFKKEIDKDFFEFQKSIHYDYKLAEYDIYHSLIHILALKESEILSSDETEKISSALKEILQEIKIGRFQYNPESEDIHSEIQNRIQKKIGDLANKLHTLRSRNDQIVFDEKCYCFDESLVFITLLKELDKSFDVLIDRAIVENQPFIGYTHTQRAQVIHFGNYLWTFKDMLIRDQGRVERFKNNLIINIGAGALIGSSISKKAYNAAIKKVISDIKETKYPFKFVENPLDSVSDRDFIIDFLSILSILQMHLSRLAEDFILYSTQEFSFFDLPEEFCTGSSLMPHKKNPDYLELMRGNTGKIYGNLISLLTTMKGLPLAYNRDMQLDKEPVFSSVKIIKEELKILPRFLSGLKLKKENIEKALTDERLYAVEIAEFLVKEKGAAFGEAHTIVGKLIRYAEDKNITIKSIDDKTLKTFHPALNGELLQKILTPQYALKSKNSFLPSS